MVRSASSNRKSISSNSSSLTSAFQPSKSGSSSSSNPSSTTANKGKGKAKSDALQLESEFSNLERLRRPRKAELNSIKLAAQVANKQARHHNPASSLTTTSNHDSSLPPSTPPPLPSSSSSKNQKEGSTYTTSRSQLIGSPSKNEAGSSSPALLGSPSSLDLFEPTKRSPVSVREDPDTGKLYLMMKNSRLKAAVAGSERSMSTRLKGTGLDATDERMALEDSSPSSSSSPRKRKSSYEGDSDYKPSSSPNKGRLAKRSNLASSPSSTPTFETAFPTVTPKNSNQSADFGRFHGNSDAASEVGAEEDEFILRPGQNKGKRVSLGSPKGLEDPNLRLKARAKAQSVNKQTEAEAEAIKRNNGSPSSAAPRRKELRREDEMDLGMGSELEGEVESDQSQGKDPTSSPDNVGKEEKERDRRGHSEELVITPRDVRERPIGLGVSPASYATPSKAAKFRTNSSHSNLLSSVKRKSKSDSSLPADISDLESALDSSTSSKPQPLPFSIASTPTSDLPPLPSSVSLSASLPLPPHYSAILTLHNALEHSLVVHLATAGTSSSSIDSLKTSSQDDDRERKVSIPNLITYTGLRPIVENSCGRRLGVTEFARLVGIWSEEEESDSESELIETSDDEIRGLGFIVNKTRTLDPKTGKKVWDWGLGIEIRVRLPPKRQITPPIQVSFGNAPSTPPSRSTSGFSSAQNSPTSGFEAFASPSKKSSTSSGGGREGMSIIALWHNGIEYRKNEVLRRLQERCGRVHQAWLESKDDQKIDQEWHSAPVGLSTPSKKGKEREVLQGEGGLLTPAATRENGRRKGARVVHFEIESQDDADESDDEGNALLMPKSDSDLHLEAGESRSRSPLLETPVKVKRMGNGAARREIRHWHPSFNLNSVASLRLANLPSLKEVPKVSNGNTNGGNLSKTIADQMSRLRQEKFSMNSSNPLLGDAPRTPSSSSSGGQLSLIERIKAKEDAKKAELHRIQAQRFGSKLTSSSGKSTKQLEMETQATLMEGYKRRAILSRVSDVADAIYMLFTTKASVIVNDSPFSSPTSKRHSPTISISEIINIIAKSTKVSFSKVEARQALDILIEIAPGFLQIINVGDKEWAKLGEGKKLSGGNGVGIGLRETKTRIARELVAPGASRN